MFRMNISICDFFAQLENINWFLLLLAIIVAVILLCNLCAGKEIVKCLMVSCQDRANNSTLDLDHDHGDYDYGARRGPHTWQTPDNNQSPININTRCVEQYCLAQPLIWTGYNVLPVGIRLENNGQTLLLHAVFQGETPFLKGADLLNSFSFYEISFRWSWYSNAGSEHTFDNEHFPLEMQCLHKIDNGNGHTASSQDLLVVSFMYSVSTENNFLDVIIRNLIAVQQAGQSVEIPPFPLSYLMPAFYTEFYSYHGSLTEPPCHRGVEWLINPQPLAISERQLHEFRKLRNRNGSRIERNARPVQQLGDRTVYLNSFSS